MFHYLAPLLFPFLRSYFCLVMVSTLDGYSCIHLTAVIFTKSADPKGQFVTCVMRRVTGASTSFS